MQAVILVGGEGTRLRPLTANMPKAMVPILNRPFLEHLLRYLASHEVKEIILATGYLPRQIQSHLGDGAGLGVNITYLAEKAPLGTSGAVKNAEALLAGPFIVFNGDILTQIDLTAMLQQHRKMKPKISIALTPVDNPTLYGVVETDRERWVKRFLEKPSWDKVISNMINAGIYIIEHDVLEHIPTSVPSMFENYLFPKLLDMGEPILAYPSTDYWIDIGTTGKYLKVNHDLLLQQGNEVLTEGKSEIHPAARLQGPVLIAGDCTIADGAQIKGPTVLGSRCKIGARAVVEGSILWPDTRVGKGAVLKNCIAASHARIEEGSQVLDNCVLGHNAVVGKGVRLINAVVEPETCLKNDIGS